MYAIMSKRFTASKEMLVFLQLLSLLASLPLGARLWLIPCLSCPSTALCAPFRIPGELERLSPGCSRFTLENVKRNRKDIYHPTRLILARGHFLIHGLFFFFFQAEEVLKAKMCLWFHHTVQQVWATECRCQSAACAPRGRANHSKEALGNWSTSGRMLNLSIVSHFYTEKQKEIIYGNMRYQYERILRFIITLTNPIGIKF